jgi:hypothetical protein
MADLTRTEIVDVLNELLTPELIDEYLFKDHPTLSMMRDMSHLEFTGRYVHCPIQFKRGGGRSASFANAQSNRTASQYDAFDVTLVSNYGTIGVDGMAMDLAKHGAASGRFIDHLEQESRSGFEKMGDDLAHNLFRDRGGARGQVGDFTGSTVTLTNISDIRFFEIGDVLKGSLTTTGGAGVIAGSCEITDLDRDAGTFDVSGAYTPTAGDYLFIEGDYDSKAAGLDAWCPAAPPGSTPFFGVDRSVAPVELGGMRFAGTGYAPAEMFIRAAQRTSRDSVKHDFFVCHPNFFGEVAVGLQANRIIRDVDIDSEYNGIGFKGLAVTVQGVGEKVLYQDPDCQTDVCWGLAMDRLGWYTLGDAPRKITEDGLEWLRASDADAYECRLVSRHNFVCPAPWNIFRCAVSATEV